MHPVYALLYCSKEIINMKVSPEQAKKYNVNLIPQKQGQAVPWECELTGYTSLEVGEADPTLEMIGIVKQRVAKAKKKEDADKVREAERMVEGAKVAITIAKEVVTKKEKELKRRENHLKRLNPEVNKDKPPNAS